MPNRRLVSGALIATLVALVGGTASAQFGHFKIPKAPSLPSVPVNVPKHEFKCSDIDEAMVDKFLKGRDARKKAEADESANQSQPGGSNAEAREAGTVVLSSAAGAVNVPFGHNSSGNNSKADKAERDASGLNDMQLAGFVESCIGALHDEAQVLSQMPKASLEAVLNREDELSKECK